ncbi:hypothetical protein ACOBQX_01455 [Actinokineospora sp. G85]|uniref:hypothetical protein n=1 Tax=Actinokineospora sp. G85 TaxID=3406626 RepID=UPI003C747C59
MGASPRATASRGRQRPAPAAPGPHRGRPGAGRHAGLFALASVFLILYLVAHALATRPWRGPRIAVALLPDIADAAVRGLVVVGIGFSAVAQVLLYLPASNRFYRR